MISRVLVPMDDSEMAERALEYALEAHPEAEILVLHIVGGGSPMMGEAMGLTLEDDFEEAAEEHASPVFERAREIARSHGKDIHTDIVGGKPADSIIDRATEFDVVVLGSHSGSIAERLFGGNVAQKVSSNATVPVTIVP